MGDADFSQTASPSKIKRNFVLLLLLGLTLVIVYLLSVMNEGRYYLVHKGSELTVERGLFLPYGRSQWESQDNFEREVYAPLPLEKPVGTEVIEVFSDRPALDRALVDFVLQQSDTLLQGGSEAALAMARLYVERALRLGGATTQQRERLEQQDAKMAFASGLNLVRMVEGTLREALGRFTQAAQGDSQRRDEARKWIREIRVRLQQVERSPDGLWPVDSRGTQAAPSNPQSRQGGKTKPSPADGTVEKPRTGDDKPSTDATPL